MIAGTTPTEPGITTSSRLYPKPEEALDRAAQAQGRPGGPEGAEVVAPAGDLQPGPEADPQPEAEPEPSDAGLPPEQGSTEARADPDLEGQVQAEPQADVDAADPVTVSRAEGRQALRAARRRLRLISIGCAVLIALCTIATVLIVDLARVRTSGLPAMAPSTRMASPSTDVHPLLPPYESTATLDALASEGGHR
jgi:hypothetical protein